MAMTALDKQRIFILGAGSISEAILKGLVGGQLLTPQQITVSNRTGGARLHQLYQRYGVQTTTTKGQAIAQSQIILLAMKPYDLVAALAEITSVITQEHLLISLAAGVTTKAIEQYLGREVAVMRAMPNTASFVLASATAFCTGRWVTSQQRELAEMLFGAMGSSIQIDEMQMDLVTALSGSGPAYFYYLVEALEEAGQMYGLSHGVSHKLLVQTIYGAAKMLLETGQDPTELRHQVTSPHGTTHAALAVLEQAGVREQVDQAVLAAQRRAREIGEQINTTLNNVHLA